MNQGYRMGRITIFARCGNTKLYYVCPITRVIKPLYRIRRSHNEYVTANN